MLAKQTDSSNVRFLWSYGGINWIYVHPCTIVNRFPYSTSSFVTKVGLCKTLHEQHWIYKKNTAEVHYPRSYEIHTDDDFENFAINFRMTACISLLTYFVTASNACSQDGKISLDVLDFAIKRVCEYVNFKEHADIDIWDVSAVSADEWDKFLEAFYKVVHDDEMFMFSSIYSSLGVQMNCKKVLMALIPHWPDMKIEGSMNLWIIKPGASSRGRGIKIAANLEEIRNHCKPGKHYVIQKYLEKPLLIHNTKFDIRQWFLVTSVCPLTIWMYNDCYLRFSSQQFSLSNLHEAVHLCNNSIQHKYKNCERHPELPEENMWHSDDFKDFLRERGLMDKWVAVMAKMQHAIVATLLASQEHLIHRVNSFTLYGADFMLSEELVPWLIEINSQPCMAPTTSVTTKMCAQVIEDTCKVVIDKRDQVKASTGGFRLAYKQKISLPSVGFKPDFRIYGSKMESPNLTAKKKSVENTPRLLVENSTKWRSIKYESVSSSRSLKSSFTFKKLTDKLPLLPGEVIPETKKPKLVEETEEESAGSVSTLKPSMP